MNPVPSLTQAYISAGALITGVIVTLAVQAIQSGVQRRLDRKGKAFEARLEAYSGFLVAIDKLNRYRIDIRKVTGDIESHKSRIAELRVTLEQVDPTPDEHKLTVRQLEELNGKLENTAKESEALKIATEDVWRDYLSVAARLRLLCDSDMLNIAAKLIEVQRAEEEPSLELMYQFRSAARRELGLKPTETWL